MSEDKTQVQFPDENETRFSQKLDYAQILFNQVEKVRTSGSVEFRGGYWDIRNKFFEGSKIEEKVYIPDTRQVYIGSVEQLFDLLISFFDDKFDIAYFGKANKAGDKKEQKKEFLLKKFEDLEKDKDEKIDDKKFSTDSELNVWYYTELKKLSRDLCRELIHLMTRMGMFGIKKSTEVY